MKLIISYLSKIFIYVLHRILYYVKLYVLEKELEKEKKESEDAIKKADDAVADFESSYELLKQSEKPGTRSSE